ncbi:GtrA family protein [Dyella sp. C11]|uniref:GtrA family protein n=1 Tax=Dyella sp. C11 TaxID=2126991 RepID=UPI000D64A0C7|nr:GtrA family protein [Dyella sp. C11]
MNHGRRFVRFVIVGIFNSAFGLGVYALLIRLGLPVWAALIAANIAGVSFNYVTTGKFAFSHRGTNRFPSFVSIYLLCYVLNYLAITVLVRMHLGPVTSQVLLTPFMAILNYLLQSRFVFAQDRTPSPGVQSSDGKD